MKSKAKRYAIMMRIAGIAIILAVLGVVGYQLYDFYRERLGYTAGKAIEDYFAALGEGDYDRVYRLTDKENLSDIYGRRVTEGEFVTQLKRITADRKLPFQKIETTKLCDARNARYYLVVLHSSIGGTQGQSRLIVEVRSRDNSWVVTYPFAIVLQ